MAEDSTQRVSDRVLTLPNILSMLRLLGVPLFIWLGVAMYLDEQTVFDTLTFIASCRWRCAHGSPARRGTS